jgi:hypothetical protein
MESLTQDPFIISPFLGIPLDLVEAFELTLDAQPEAPDLVELFFLTDGQFTFDQDLRVGEGGPLGMGRRIRFAVPPEVRTRGEHLLRIRIDPTIRRGVRFRLNSLKILPRTER